MNANLNYSRQRRFEAVVGHDPFQCLRCFSIGVAIWNILYCLVQFGLLGWQVQVVKEWQWHWENRALPVTGAIDQYQARFPGLYAIYTETPERRRVNEFLEFPLWRKSIHWSADWLKKVGSNYQQLRKTVGSAMYAIVLICLGLTFVHFFLSAAMLYGCVKRLPQWLFPWFFSSIPLIVLSTAYSVLWWSGDVFNEQLTFSVAQFAMSLAVNGVCFVVVLLYYFRLRGKLTSERTDGEFSPKAIHQQQQQQRRRTSKIIQKLPPWDESFPEKVPSNIARKLRRKERRERQLSKRDKAEKKSKAEAVLRRERVQRKKGNPITTKRCE